MASHTRIQFSNSQINCKYNSAFSRRDARVVHDRFAQKRGRGGMPGAQCTRSLACRMKVSTRASSPQVHQNNPAFPHAMVLTVSFVISSVIGLLSPSPADDGLVSPVGPAKTSANLTPAPGRQDHTTSPSASASFVFARPDRSRGSTRPAIPWRAQCCRVHRIPPRVRDDHDTPLCGVG
jgi:hypothetical protein